MIGKLEDAEAEIFGASEDFQMVLEELHEFPDLQAEGQNIIDNLSNIVISPELHRADVLKRYTKVRKEVRVLCYNVLYSILF